MLIRSAAFTVFLIVLFAAGYALAQQPVPAPREQVLTQRLINEINNGIACQTNLIDVQQQVAKLQADLKSKDEPGAKKQDRRPK
jgi:hypothetical protein